MRVLFITSNSMMYGANLALLTLIKYLRDDYDVKPVVLLNSEGDLTNELARLQIPFRISYYTMSVVRKGNFPFILRVIVKKIIRYPTYRRALSIIKNSQFDLIHSNSSVCDLGYYMSRWIGIPHVWHIREHGEDDYGLYSINNYRKAIRMYTEAAACVSISESISEVMRSMDEGISVRQIMDGIDIPKAYRKKYLNDTTVRFVIVGLICKSKGQETVIRAAKRLKDSKVLNYVISFIGGGEERYIDELKKTVADSGLKEKVLFLGYRDDVENLLRHQDIGITASRKEAFGRVTVEYMANYMPVIGTAEGETKYLIKGGNGFLYQYEDAEQLANHMKFFIEHTDRIPAMGLRSRMLSEEYDSEKNASEVFELYKTIVGNKEWAQTVL